MSRSLKYDSNFFFNHRHIYIYMDTTTDHFTPLALRVRGNNQSQYVTAVGKLINTPRISWQASTKRSIPFDQTLSLLRESLACARVLWARIKTVYLKVAFYLMLQIFSNYFSAPFLTDLKRILNCSFMRTYLTK